MKGNLTISRFGGKVRISLEDDKSSIEFLQIGIDYKVFAETLMGLAHGDCEFKLVNTDRIGKRREIKEELVTVPDSDFSGRESAAVKAVAVFEKDGWTARVSDAMNHHRLVEYKSGNAVYKVTFIRFVDDDCDTCPTDCAQADCG